MTRRSAAFCGRNLPLGAAKIEERRVDFMAGPTTSGEYAIWNESVGGPPVQSFTDDEVGWAAAADALDELEATRASSTPPRVSIPAALLALAGLLVAIGSFLPWFTASLGSQSFSENGLSAGGDGIITLVVGVALIVLGVAVFVVRRATTVVVLLSFPVVALAAGVALLDYLDISIIESTRRAPRPAPRSSTQ